MVQRKSWHIKHNIIYGPHFFQAGSAMLHREFTKPEHRRNGAPLMSDKNSINVSVVVDAAAYGGLPIHRIIFWCLNPCEVRVF